MLEHKVNKLGLGTENERSPEVLTEYLKAANLLEYDFIDCAWRYGNEPYIGMALKDIKKEDMSFEIKLAFQSKVWPTKFQGGINKSIKFALQKIGAFPYIDVYFLHKPAEDIDLNVVAWSQLISCQKRGQALRIGVGDFDIPLMEHVYEKTHFRPHVLQFPISINNIHIDVIRYCREHGIEIQTCDPMGDFEKNSEAEIIKKLASKYKTTPKNILLAFLMHIGIVPIANAANIEELKDFPSCKKINFEKEELKQMIKFGSPE